MVNTVLFREDKIRWRKYLYAGRIYDGTPLAVFIALKPHHGTVNYFERLVFTGSHSTCIFRVRFEFDLQLYIGSSRYKRMLYDLERQYGGGHAWIPIVDRYGEHDTASKSTMFVR